MTTFCVEIPRSGVAKAEPRKEPRADRGKPYRPTTQGKSETLPSEAVPLPQQAVLAATLDQLQRSAEWTRIIDGVAIELSSQTALTKIVSNERMSPMREFADVVDRTRQSPTAGVRTVKPLDVV